MNATIAPLYFLLVAWRAYGIYSMLVRLPRYRGASFFFDTPVEPGFYRSRDPKLRQYRNRILWPHAADLALALIAGFATHWNFLALFVIEIIFATAWSAWHHRSYRACAPPPASALAVSLVPRELKNYRQRACQWTIYAALVLSIACLAIDVARLHGNVEWPDYLLAPAVCAYLVLGGWLAQRHFLAARLLSAPADAPPEIAVVREAIRRHWIFSLDAVRVAFALLMLASCLMAVIPEPWWQASQRYHIFSWIVFAALAACFVAVRLSSARILKAAKQVPAGARRSVGARPSRKIDFNDPRTWGYVAYFGGWLAIGVEIVRLRLS